ncbi:MAG: ATP-binding protein [Verrucomicrobiota bacterium]
MNSIRKRVLAALLLVGLLPLVIIFLTTQTLTSRALYESEHDKLSEIGNEVARQVAGIMDNRARDLESLRSNPFLVDPSATPEERLKEMERLVGVYDLFTDISLYDKSGNLVNSTTFVQPELVERSVWFTRALEGKVSISTPSALLGQPGLHLTVYLPVLSKTNNERHVIKARIPFASVWELLDSVVIGAGGAMILLDHSGNILSHRNKGLIYEKFDERFSHQFWRAHDNGTYTDPHGIPYTYVAIPLDEISTRVGTPWTLLAMQPASEVNAIVNQTLLYQLGIAAVTVVFASSLGFFLSRKLASPVITASKAAQRVADGEMDIRIPQTGPIEMQEMASSFNQMVLEVTDYRERLESLVDSRTTKLRESQKELRDLTAQLRATYESTEEAILVVKPDGKILTANKRIQEFFGLQNENVWRMNFSDFINEVHTSFVENDDESPIESPTDRWHFYKKHGGRTAQEEWKLKSPSARALSVYSAPVSNSSGEEFARLWMFRDMTETRELEESLRQAQKLEAIGRLAGGIAHDFNNLLTGIIGNLSLAELTSNPDSGERQDNDTHKLIASAKKAGQRAAELVKQLLGFSRRTHLQIEACDLNYVIAEIKQLLVHTLDPRIQIDAKPNEDLWTVNADPTQIEQVIMNLCVNARDALPEDGGVIRIASENVDISEEEAERITGATPGPCVRLSVYDNGCGMSEEIQSKIFEPFFTTKEQGKGTGLGLATSYGIVRQHGGWITCSSKFGEGTTFYVYLPRLPKAVPIEDKPAPSIPSAALTNGEETILLVDDEPIVRAVAEGVLKQFGYTIHCASDGEEAIEICDRLGDKIDLVLLDLTMPKLSGSDTFQKLRKGHANLPVVICSGYIVDPDLFEKETGSRPDAFVQKPYQIDDLASTIRSVFDRAAPAVA